MHSVRRIAVLGLGYIGLPTAAAFADQGVDVLGVDTDPRVLERIRAGAGHLPEPELGALVRRGLGSGRLTVSGAVAPADAFIIAVPTPLRGDTRAADLRAVESAARAIAPVLEQGNLVVLESTAPVGTTERVSALLAEARGDLRFPHEAGQDADVRVAHCPERVLPGRIVEELASNARVIGGMTRRCAEHAAGLYRIIAHGECRLTDARTAELAKLAENAYRDVNIAFANELAGVCEALGLDARELIAVANLHPRVDILNPGPGVGGHCIAVDPWFIAGACPDRTRLIQAARAVNDARPDAIVAMVQARAAAMERPVIACLGLAYKKDVDDLRESPAVRIVGALADAACGSVLAVEPHISVLPPALAGRGVVLCEFEQAIERAHVVVLLVGHRGFLRIDRARLVGKVVIDTRGVW